MRYNLINGIPVVVRQIEVESNRVTNPTDDQIDSAHAGYPLDETEPELPVIDTATQKITYGYTLSDGLIVRTAVVENKTTAEKIADIDSQIAALNAAFMAYKDSPITYTNRKQYLPRWVYEFYNSMLILGAQAFPLGVSAVDGTADTMTFEQFQALYQFLVTEVATHTATVNAQIAALNAEKSALVGGE